MAVMISMAGCGSGGSSADIGSSSAAVSSSETAASQSSYSGSLSEVPAYSGDASITINNNVPEFTDRQLSSKESYQKYGRLDSLGRATACTALIDKDTMPVTGRGSIGMIKPSGWHLVKYDFINGKYLYNRCHLIAFCLTGVDGRSEYLARDLVTGTRYMNIEGQLPFEEETADYIKDTGNHVLYRVTPVFRGRDLLCSGVHMEAESIEDHGSGIKFNVYCYNVQPGVAIDYASGDNHKVSGSAALAGSDSSAVSEQKTDADTSQAGRNTYVININTRKFHRPDCPSVKQTLAKNRKTVHEKRAALIKEGYSPCKNCRP